MTNWIQRATLNRSLSDPAGWLSELRLKLLTTIHDFGSGRDGENPQAGVVFDQAGNLYGTAALGALNGNGIVFSLTLPDGGSGPWTEVCPPQFYRATGRVGACELRGPYCSGKIVRYNFGRWGE